MPFVVVFRKALLIPSGNPIWRRLKLNVFYGALFLEKATHTTKHAVFFKIGVTVEPLLGGHSWARDNWPLNRGGRLIGFNRKQRWERSSFQFIKYGFK